MKRILANKAATRPSASGVWFRLCVTSLIVPGLLLTGAGIFLEAPVDEPVLAIALDQILVDGAKDGEAAWGDLDGDGDMDVIMTGRNNAGTQTFYLRNHAGTLQKTVTELPGTEFGSIAPGDFDRDGDLDVFITGQTGVPGGKPTGVAAVYANAGGAVFSEHQSFPGLYRSSGNWGDYDSDGDLDLILCGFQTGGAGYGGLYRNDEGVFNQDTSVDVPAVGDCSVQFGDYNLDDDLDFVITGRVCESGSLALAQVFNNNGNGDYSAGFVMGGLWSSSVDWVDLENDGDLDLLVTGNSGSSTEKIPVTRLYRYSGSFNQIPTTLPAVWQSSTAWGDYDNDGDPDLLINGLTTSQHLTRLYLNTGDGFTDAQVDMRSGTGASVTWGHLDGSNSLDLLVTGIEDENTEISTFVYRGTPAAANTVPSSPSLVRGCWDRESRVYLDWYDAVDAQTPSGGLTYSLRIGASPGQADVMNPSADGSGLRQLAAPGNVQAGSATFLGLPYGEYYWSVQAVDSAYIGGAFREEGFFSVGTMVAQDDEGFYTADQTPIDIPVLSNDLTGYGSLKIVWPDNPPHGSASVVGDVIRYTPDSGYAGPDSFGYYAHASQGHCSRAVVSLLVTGIRLSSREVPEDRPAGERVGILSTSDPTPGQTFTYSLVGGSGGEDNASFEIANGSELRTTAVFDYETKHTYTVRVRSAGSLGSTYEKAFTILVIAPPNDILLSNHTVAEGQPVNTAVGAFTSSDPEPGAHYYQLVSGAGSTDNGSFNIASGQLRTSAVFDYETKDVYSIRVRSTDNHGLAFEKPFNIAITDETEPALEDILLSKDFTFIDLPANTSVGQFSTVGGVGPYRYTFADGEDCGDRFNFVLFGDVLITGRTYTAADKNQMNICIRSTDSDGTEMEKAFTIYIYRRTFLPAVFRNISGR